MKKVLLLYTESDRDKAEDLQDYLQIRLRTLADIRNVSFICHDSVNSKGLFIVRTRLPPRVYSLSPQSSKYKDVYRPSGVTV